MAMDARRWNEAGQALEQLEGSEARQLATVQIGLGEPVHQASLRRGEGRDAGGGVKPFQSERSSGTVANDPLETRPVLGLDADGAKIGDLPPAAQAMLLRTLGEGEVVPVGGTRPKQVDVRVIAATSRNLKPMIAAGSFRADLHYRLRHLHVAVPTLRERGDDWRLIADHLLDGLAGRASAPKRFCRDSLSVLESYDWPGNVREVRSVVDTGFHLSRSDLIQMHDFREALEDAAQEQQLDRVAALIAQDYCSRLVRGEESFWEAVHRPFLDRHLNREQVREIVAEGLRRSHGSYKRMVDAFGIPQSDYLKLMDFLRHHDLKPEVYRTRRRTQKSAPA